ncbi:carboxypeptidase-like regulatory domain-containing protein [Lysobacter sp. 2RAF19]
MKKSLVFSILLLAAQSASAKCMPAYHVFSGVAVDDNGKPISGASIGISWFEVDGPAGPALAMTDASGRYSIPAFFDTYSGKGAVVEDACNWRVRFVSVSAFKAGRRSPYTRVRVGSSEAVRVPAAVISLKVEVKEDTLLPFLKGPKR